MSSSEVSEALSRMPQTLKTGLMPFQWEGVRFGLQRSTRCLIGDEMGASSRAGSWSLFVFSYALQYDSVDPVSTPDNRKGVKAQKP